MDKDEGGLERLFDQLHGHSVALELGICIAWSS